MVSEISSCPKERVPRRVWVNKELKSLGAFGTLLYAILSSVVWISSSPTLAQTQLLSQSDDVTKLLADAYLTR